MTMGELNFCLECGEADLECCCDRDEELSEKEAPRLISPSTYQYLGYKIRQIWIANSGPPEYGDWDFIHDDYDLDDPRAGAGATLEHCVEQINEIEEDLE